MTDYFTREILVSATVFCSLHFRGISTQDVHISSSGHDAQISIENIENFHAKSTLGSIKKLMGDLATLHIKDTEIQDDKGTHKLVRGNFTHSHAAARDKSEPRLIIRLPYYHAAKLLNDAYVVTKERQQQEKAAIDHVGTEKPKDRKDKQTTKQAADTTPQLVL